MKGRTYRYMEEKPLFSFGYGLSYTSFDIFGAKLSKSSVKAGQGVVFQAKVKNTGRCDGHEVVQVYIRKAGDVEGPLKSLRGFQGISLKAGETGVVSIALEPSAFEFFDAETNTMRVMPGEYVIMYGNSSDTPLENQLRITLR